MPWAAGWPSTIPSPSWPRQPETAPSTNTRRFSPWSFVAVAHRSCPVSSLLGDESLVAAVAGGFMGVWSCQQRQITRARPGPGCGRRGRGMAAGSGLLVEVGRPGVVVAGVTGEVHDRGP